jgi:hypothetical protein
MLKLKNNRVRHFTPSPVRVLDKFPHGERFFSPYSKNLSPCGKSSNQSINNLSLASHRTGRITDFCLCFASMSLNLPHGERFLPYGEKNLTPCRNLSRTRTGLGTKRQTLYCLTVKMKSKFLKFKILQRIIRKFPAIQWNRSNVILFHETIPLNLKTTYLKLTDDCYFKNIRRTLFFCKPV